MKGQSQQRLRPCLSEGGLQTSSIFSAWKLKRHNIRSHPSPAESESRSPEIAVARERGKQHRGPARSPAGPGPGGAALCSRVFLRDQHWFPCSCLTVVTLVPFAVDIKPRSGCTGLSPVPSLTVPGISRLHEHPVSGLRRELSCGGNTQKQGGGRKRRQSLTCRLEPGVPGPPHSCCQQREPAGLWLHLQGTGGHRDKPPREGALRGRWVGRGGGGGRWHLQGTAAPWPLRGVAEGSESRDRSRSLGAQAVKAVVGLPSLSLFVSGAQRPVPSLIPWLLGQILFCFNGRPGCRDTGIRRLPCVLGAGPLLGPVATQTPKSPHSSRPWSARTGTMPALPCKPPPTPNPTYKWGIRGCPLPELLPSYMRSKPADTRSDRGSLCSRT